MNPTLPLLTPYSHPTSICFIDDNETFMAGLTVVLPPYATSVGFFDPVKALAHINRAIEPAPLAQRCFSSSGGDANLTFSLDTDLLEQEISVVDRFQRLSVVVVDYSMPTINGLELCEQINDPNIGKVLLTGVADEKMAVEAFNAGIIDRFIAKSHPQATAYIEAFTHELQHAYFRKQTAQITTTLRLTGELFLDDSVAAAWIQDQLVQLEICEHYVVSAPPGLLVVTPRGNLQQLIIMREDQCDDQVAYAQTLGAPAAIIERLRARSHIGFFADDPATYNASEAYPWVDALVPCRHLKGNRSDWYVAVVAEPPPYIDYSPDDACHATWMRVRRDSWPDGASRTLPDL